MTKGITQFFIGAALFAGIATADTDLFAKLSNGAMSDKSEGITELSREQKAKVVGGYYVIETSKFNYRDGGVIYPYSYQTGIVFSLSNHEMRNGYACLGDGDCLQRTSQGLFVSARDVQRYRYYTALVNPASEDLVMLTRYNYSSKGYNQHFGVVDRGSGKIKRMVWGAAAAEILGAYGTRGTNHNARVRFPY